MSDWRFLFIIRCEHGDAGSPGIVGGGPELRPWHRSRCRKLLRSSWVYEPLFGDDFLRCQICRVLFFEHCFIFQCVHLHLGVTTISQKGFRKWATLREKGFMHLIFPVVVTKYLSVDESPCQMCPRCTKTSKKPQSRRISRKRII